MSQTSLTKTPEIIGEHVVSTRWSLEEPKEFPWLLSAAPDKPVTVTVQEGVVLRITCHQVVETVRQTLRENQRYKKSRTRRTVVVPDKDRQIEIKAGTKVEYFEKECNTKVLCYLPDVLVDCTPAQLVILRDRGLDFRLYVYGER